MTPTASARRSPTGYTQARRRPGPPQRTTRCPRGRLAALDLGKPPEPTAAPDSRGRIWLSAGRADRRTRDSFSAPRAHRHRALPRRRARSHNPFHRARDGRVGLTESLALAQAVRALVDADDTAAVKRAIVAVVDLPSQAYGRIEETVGLHQAMACAVDAYHHARTSGHPVVALVVGQALSGGFLTHGLQADQILALDDPGVEIHAMHRAAAARITLRTVEELDELAKTITPLSYRVTDWATLGFCDGLLAVDNPGKPRPADVASVSAAVLAAIDRARAGPRDLSNRLDSAAAARTRHASRAVRELLVREWDQD
jgi:malonate decarboxylase beta subunit